MNLKKQFWKHVLPSVAAFAFSGLYTIVDGFFVGQNIGDQGLAAVNIAYPVSAFIQAVGTGIGMAGAIWIAISQGQKNQREERRYLGSTLSLLLLAGVAVTVVLALISQPLLRLLGASGRILTYASAYLNIIVWGAVFQLCAVGLLPVIRNFNGSFAAMLAMIAGFAANILLDWYFTSVLKQGTAGAALATVLGQAVALLPCIAFILRRRAVFFKARLKLRAECVKKILATMLAPFGAVLSPVLIILIVNRAALAYGGEAEVACYAVISYVTSVVYLLLQGIGDGVQPLIGQCHGANDGAGLKLLKKMAFSLALAAAAACLVLLGIGRELVPAVFGASAGVSALYKRVVLYFLAGFPAIAVTKLSISYCYATGRNRLAYCLIYAEPVLTLTAAALLPLAAGINGVWAAVPAVQWVLTAASLTAFKRIGAAEQESAALKRAV